MHDHTHPTPPAEDTDFLRLVDEALDRGVGFLLQHQFPNGEFCVYRAFDAAMEKGLAPDSAVFPTALAANCLLFLKDAPGVEEMLARTTQFLVEERMRGGLWCHFTRPHRMRTICPPDSDDTACVSLVLKARGITAQLAQNVRLLLLNRNSEGLFHTMFVTRFYPTFDRLFWKIVLAEWKHPLATWKFWTSTETLRYGIDAVVNANVLHYLGDIPESRQVIDFLLRLVAAGDETRRDLWYQDPNVIYYFLSRNLLLGIPKLEPIRQPIRDRVWASSQPDGSLGSSILETATGLCALLNAGEAVSRLKPAILFLLRNQQPGGEWPRRLVYYGGPKKLVGWGSEELVTAFCLEALARFRSAFHPAPQETF